MEEGVGVDPDDSMDPEDDFMVEADHFMAFSIEDDTWSISTALSHKVENVWDRPAVPRAFWISGLRPR